MRIGHLKIDRLGLATQEVEILYETPHGFRLRAISRTRLWRQKRSLWLDAGTFLWVRKPRLLEGDTVDVGEPTDFQKENATCP